jgi:hypothetical protein
VGKAPVLGFSKLGLMLRDPRMTVGPAVVSSLLLGEPEGLPRVTVGVPLTMVGAWVVAPASGDPSATGPALAGTKVGDVVDDRPVGVQSNLLVLVPVRRNDVRNTTAHSVKHRRCL